MLARRSARNNPQSFAETPGKRPNLAGVEMFFTPIFTPKPIMASGAAALLG
jgi:hypothetical protein